MTGCIRRTTCPRCNTPPGQRKRGLSGLSEASGGPDKITIEQRRMCDVERLQDRRLHGDPAGGAPAGHRVYRAHRRRVLCRKAARGVGRKTGKSAGRGQRKHPEEREVRGGPQHGGTPGHRRRHRRGHSGRRRRRGASGHRQRDGGGHGGHPGLSGQHAHPGLLSRDALHAGHPADGLAGRAPAPASGWPTTTRTSSTSKRTAMS